MQNLPEFPSQYLNPEYPEFWPTEPDDFIGGARELAVNIRSIVERHKPGGLPIKLLISGEPGYGKSSLALFIMHLLNCTKWAASTYSGADVTIDVVRELAMCLRLSANELFGDYRMIVIQEVDASLHAAQTRFLDVMDNLPKKTAVICTCNSKVNELEKRFQTRFKAMAPRKATEAEVIGLIQRWPVPSEVARMIAKGADGNVRVALLEAEEWLQTKYVAAAA